MILLFIVGLVSLRYKVDIGKVFEDAFNQTYSSDGINYQKVHHLEHTTGGLEALNNFDDDTVEELEQEHKKIVDVEVNETKTSCCACPKDNICSIWTYIFSWMYFDNIKETNCVQTCSNNTKQNTIDYQFYGQNGLNNEIPNEIIESISSMIPSINFSSFFKEETEHHASSLVFLHMTHTGGSSIRKLISHICETRKLNCYLKVSKKLPQTLAFHSLDILYGHFEFDPILLKKFMKPCFFTFTILRDPFEIFG